MTVTETPRLPENAGKFVPVQTRSERPKSFTPEDFAAPKGREVDWKYSPVAKFAELFVNEPGAGKLKIDVSAPESVSLGTLAEGAAPRGTGLVPEDLPSAIASRQTAEAAYIAVPADTELDAPITITVSGEDAAAREFAHIVLHAQANAKATIVLDHTGSVLLSENVEIVVDEGASLDVIVIHDWNDDAVHTGSHQAVLAKDAYLKHTIVTFGGEVVRVNPSLHLNGTGSEGIAKGLYFSDAGQHFEHQVYIDHVGERTVSDVNYKGALQGAGARSVWIGDVLIRQSAVGTESYEQNRNLVLSNGARADSVPNLEIETGDIAGAGHASATGRFEEDQLFYLMARGIDEPTARRLVVHGFLNEIVQSISVPELQERMRESLERELENSIEALMAQGAVR
ncbi:Fe-S cluster assembly protein SufD [Gulosibacter bifidus]|uniref:Fe-S cluster assembly protein SufD n=1 Tax=Gulosibacter bifidus TaxID=272239 RepID=A0ABW5RGG4_9MICO|nr:Fe-S cluster assembly protein SufD [Gulosibacter bifidus]